jgi:hypothetical protein
MGRMVNLTPEDPVVVRRRRIARWVSLAKRVGYTLLLGAVVAFAAAVVAGFPSWLVNITVVALVGACIVLPVPIVLGYGLRAAERDERADAVRRAGGGPPPTQR